MRYSNGESKYYYDGKNVLLKVAATEENTASSRLNVYGITLVFTVVVSYQEDLNSSLLIPNSSLNIVYIYNGHADVIAVCDEDGVLLNIYLYDAFGNITYKLETVINRYNYSGYEYDSKTGLYYLRSRYYDPITARFISRDTFNGFYNDPLSLNRYTYCHNNPVSYYDPDGEFFNFIAGLVGAVVGAVVSATVNVVTQVVNGAKLNEVDWKSVGISAMEGGIVGGVAGLTAGNPLAIATASAGANYLSQGLTKGFDNIDGTEVVISGVVGFIGAAAGQEVSKMVSTAVKPIGAILLRGAGNALASAGTDAVGQLLSIAAGKQDKFDFERTVKVTAIGFSVGAISESVSQIGKAITVKQTEAKLNDLVKQSKEILGDDVRVITNESGDKIFLGEKYKIRFDINNPSPHASPHMHIEELIGGNWKDTFKQIYPNDVLQK